MMALQFPTMAEQAVGEFNAATKTIALATIAKRMGAEYAFCYPTTTYTFDDDTSITVTGRGRAWRVETHLP